MFPLGILSTLAPPAHPPPKKRTNAPPNGPRLRDFDAFCRSLGNNCMHASKSRYRGFRAGPASPVQAPLMPLAPYPREPVADFRGPVLTNMKDTMCWRERIANEEHTA